MAAALMRHLAGNEIDAESAGTQPGDSINTVSAGVLGEINVEVEADMRIRTPQPVTG